IKGHTALNNGSAYRRTYSSQRYGLSSGLREIATQGHRRRTYSSQQRGQPFEGHTALNE
ncbi:Unknown protein, partial [Striga hermonthica]